MVYFLFSIFYLFFIFIYLFIYFNQDDVFGNPLKRIQTLVIGPKKILMLHAFSGVK